MRKYRINEFLEKLAYNDYRRAIKIIPTSLGISNRTFQTWRKIEICDTQTIPADYLIALAKFFGITAEQMVNGEIIKIGEEKNKNTYGLKKPAA